MNKVINFTWSIKSFRPYIMLMMLLNLGYSIVIYASAEVLNQATSIIETGQTERIQSIIIFAAVSTVLFVAFGFGAGIVRQYLINKTSENVEGRLLSHLYSIPKKRREMIGSGAFLSKMSLNTASAVEGSYSVFFRFSEGFFTVIFGGIYMFLLSPALAGLFLLYNIVFRIATRPYDKAIKNAATRQVAIRNRNTAFSTELLKNALMVRTFHCFPYFFKRFHNYEEDEQRNNLKLFMLQNSYDEVMWFSKKMMEIILPFGLGAVLMVLDYMTFAHVIAFTVANDLFSKGFNNMINAIISINSCLPHIDAVNEFLDEPEEKAESHDTVDDKVALVFENVAFKYAENTVLENVTFTINEGKWVKITGPNGQGKSTLLRLIAGLHQPDSGRIHLHSNAIRCYIPQFPEIIPEGACENIALEDPHVAQSCEDILEGLRMAGVDRSTPDRYSHGEKQRLMIGRAVYHLDDRSLILGDEIFSNIDKQNQSKIADYLRKKCAGSTVFMVCHEDMGIPFDLTLHVENRQVSILEGGKAS